MQKERLHEWTGKPEKDSTEQIVKSGNKINLYKKRGKGDLLFVSLARNKQKDGKIEWQTKMEGKEKWKKKFEIENEKAQKRKRASRSRRQKEHTRKDIIKLLGYEKRVSRRIVTAWNPGDKTSFV